MALVHVLQRRVETTLHADVQTVDAAGAQASKLGISLVFDVLDGGVHGDGLHLRKLPVDGVGNLLQPIRREHKGVAVLQKDPAYIRVLLRGFLNIRLDLLHGADRELHIRVHITEGALVVAAAKGHLQQKRIGFIGRPVDGSGEIHLVSLPFICAMYSLPQVSMAAMTG